MSKPWPPRTEMSRLRNPKSHHGMGQINNREMHGDRLVQFLEALPYLTQALLDLS
jgi:hypothetical protein